MPNLSRHELFADIARLLDAGKLTRKSLEGAFKRHIQTPRLQRLMYLHASTPNIRAGLVGCAIHEPVAGSVTEIDPSASDPPYSSVHHAILDGWRVIHFPDQRAPFDDREIDILGYEFILEKLVPANHGGQ